MDNAKQQPPAYELSPPPAPVPSAPVSMEEQERLVNPRPPLPSTNLLETCDQNTPQRRFTENWAVLQAACLDTGLEQPLAGMPPLRPRRQLPLLGLPQSQPICV
jgi:hypothetical protein